MSILTKTRPPGIELDLNEIITAALAELGFYAHTMPNGRVISEAPMSIAHKAIALAWTRDDPNHLILCKLCMREGRTEPCLPALWVFGGVTCR